MFFDQFFHFIAQFVDYTPYAALLFGIYTIILGFTKGFKNKPLGEYMGEKPTKWAWIAVAVLWVVVMLNYFDRQLLSTLNKSVTDPETGIAMSQEQFGLIVSVFLLVYALLSPVGGYLADRFSRKLIIMLSLVVWSLVTWWTGKSESFEELMLARAAMGVSEAFYVPAALALITDYHRGGTRSMATGLHMSGIYAGSALAGYGAMIAGEPIGLTWQITFEAFGLIGVAYALVIILFLREPEGAKDAVEAKAATTPAVVQSEFSVATVARQLLTNKAMIILMTMIAFAGFANWFILNWYPRLIQDLYNVSESEAGPMATGPISIVKYASVLIAAALADAWMRKNKGARAYVPGIAFCIAGPCVLVAMLPSFGIPLPITLGFGIALVSMQGLAQGALDANLMPVLRSQIDERFSATGYGMLNLTSAGVGAIISFAGGSLLDQGIPLSMVLGVGGGLMLLCGVLLLKIGRSSQQAIG